MDWQDLARRQHGTIARRQLENGYLSHDQVDRLVSRRNLLELLPGVYSPRPVPASFRQRLWAASLWSDGVISHRSAARLWQIPAESTTTVHLTVADRRYRQLPPGIRLHRVQLERSAVTAFDGIAVTNRSRTVIDLMRTERYGLARDLRDRALQVGWVDERAIFRSVYAQPGRTGNAQLRRLLGELETGTQAESERLLHVILRGAKLTGWKPQYRIRIGSRTMYADVAFPGAKLVIEVDGRRYHGDESERFEDDRDRQNALMVGGWRVLRFTWAMLNDAPHLVLARIVQSLAA